MSKANDSFSQFLTDGNGDSQPVERMDTYSEEKVEVKGNVTTQIKAGIILSIPNTYSRVEYEETVQINDDSKLEEARTKLMHDVAQTTYTMASNYLMQLVGSFKNV